MWIGSGEHVWDVKSTVGITVDYGWLIDRYALEQALVQPVSI
jgi:hypothetical protein